jgi:hypothetical protein
VAGRPADHPVFRTREIDNYLDGVFDGAQCASANLPASMFEEYRQDNLKSGSSPGHWLNNTLRNLQAFRVIVATGVGIIVLVLWWVLLFAPHRELWLAIGLSAASMIVVVASGNVPGERYEPGIQPLVIMTAAGCLYVVGRRLSAWFSSVSVARA